MDSKEEILRDIKRLLYIFLFAFAFFVGSALAIGTTIKNELEVLNEQSEASESRTTTRNG